MVFLQEYLFAVWLLLEYLLKINKVGYLTSDWGPCESSFAISRTINTKDSRSHHISYFAKVGRLEPREYTTARCIERPCTYASEIIFRSIYVYTACIENVL
jgi:hypothetical protein